MKNNKFLKTLFSLGIIATLGTIAITPITQTDIDDQVVTTATDDPSIAAINTPVILATAFDQTADASTGPRIKVTFRFSGSRRDYEFRNNGTFNTPNAIQMRYFDTSGTAMASSSGLAANDFILENSVTPTEGEIINIDAKQYSVIFHTNQKVPPANGFYNWENRNFYTEGTLILGYGVIYGLSTDPTSADLWTAYGDVFAVPRQDISNPAFNYIDPVTSGIAIDTTAGTTKLTFNLKPPDDGVEVDSSGWIIGDAGIKIFADDGVNSRIQISPTNITLPAPGEEISNQNIVAKFSNDVLATNTPYDIYVEYDYGVYVGSSQTNRTRIPNVTGTTNSQLFLIQEAGDPTISNFSYNDDLSSLSFTLNLDVSGTTDGLARFIDGTGSPFALYWGTGTSKTRITQDVLTIAGEQDPPTDGVAFAYDSYDFTLDISTLKTVDDVWNTSDVLEQLVIAVGYGGDDITVDPYTYSAHIGSIPRDVAPTTITTTSTVTDETNTQFTFKLSDVSPRGWVIGPEGIEILKIPSDGSGAITILDATFQGVNLGSGRAIPAGDIVTTIPMTNFSDTLDYDIQIEANYAVSSLTTDAIVGPVNLVSSLVPVAIHNIIEGLTASQSTIAGAIDLQWDATLISSPSTIYYFAVRNTLSPDAGWRIYSSEQSSFVTINADGLSGTIQDSSFIEQGYQYDISVAINVDLAELVYLSDNIWTGWDGETSSAPQTGITITQYVTSYATPTTLPKPMEFSYASSTSRSVLFDFTYDNGSLEYDPIISAEIAVLGDATYTDVLPSNINILFNPISGTGSIEILNLVPEVAYTVIFTYDYQVQDPVVYQALDTDPTLAVVSSITIDSSLDLTDGIELLTMVISGEKITNTIGIYADIVITNSIGESVSLSSVSNPEDPFIATHAINISSLTSFISLTINIIAYDDALIDPIPLDLDDIIISDGASDSGIDVIYNLNGNSADDSLIGEPTSITPSEGVQDGEVNIVWDVNYPLGITNLSQLTFTFEISTTDPSTSTDWINVTNQTTGIGADMKSATITGLSGADYEEGVWVRLTIDYPSVEGYVPTQVTSSIEAIPKQPKEIAPSGLSTELLIGIIAGSAAALILISLGVWYYVRKRNRAEEVGDETPTPPKTVAPKKTTTAKKQTPAKKTTTTAKKAPPAKKTTPAKKPPAAKKKTAPNKPLAKPAAPKQ